MSKIPTAEEFLKSKLSEIHEEKIFEDLLQRMFTVDVSKAMIEFTKLHVQAALEAAHKIVVQEGLVTNAGIAYFENSKIYQY